MGASINAGQGSKRRSTEVGKAQALHSSRRVPELRRYATLFTTAPRPSFFFLPSSSLASPPAVCDDKLDLISRLLSCDFIHDTFLHTFSYSPPLSTRRATMPFVVSAWY